MCVYLTRSVDDLMFIQFPPIPPISPLPPYIWIQIGAKLSQQLLHPLQTRPVFLELSVGKASTNRGSPRDLYERHTRKKKRDRIVRLERGGLGEKGVKRDTSCALQ